MKLWEKGIDTNVFVNQFTVGNDRDFDKKLAPFDVLGTLAHVKMLTSVGLLKNNEYEKLKPALHQIFKQVSNNDFTLDESVEDIHSQVEWMLTQTVGEAGKKVHSARSRNDQVLVDIKMYLRSEIQQLTALLEKLFHQLMALSEKHKNSLMPGYTHLQIAMPSSFGLWFGAYAESLVDDLDLLKCSFNQVNQSPLGSAAGYGSSFPIKRQMTSELLGFNGLNYNVVYAQMNRGKTEQTLAFALAGMAGTLSKMAMDMCLFNSQNFGFISFPDEFTTGSSIMPHKKNPDVWELVRAKSNRIKSLPNELLLLTSNLPSGYHRDLQLTKEILFPAIADLKDCLAISELMLSEIVVNENILDDEKYRVIFSVENVNNKVLEGVPFRDAYKQVAQQVNTNNFHPDHTINHTHEGSLGYLCNDKIMERFKQILTHFDFEKVAVAFRKLLNSEE